MPRIKVICTTGNPAFDVHVVINSKYPAFGIGLNPEHRKTMPAGAGMRNWGVYHIPRGTLIMDWHHKNNCPVAVVKLSELGDWNKTRNELPPELLLKGRQLIMNLLLAEKR